MESVLREQLANGTYRVGQRLPTQLHLAADFGVSRDTIQRVLRKLSDEGWVESRQGSGMRVLKVPQAEPAGTRPKRRVTTSLGPLIHHAFEQPVVTLDTFALTSETLWNHLKVQAERVVSGEVEPERVRLRMLLPSEKVKLAYPAAKDEADDRIWQRWRAMARRYAIEINGLMEQLRARGVDAQAEIRRVEMTPQYKLYVINEEDLLFGLYEVFERTITLEDGTAVPALDVLGLGSVLSHYRAEATEAGAGGPDGADGHDGRIFATMRASFESYWERLSEAETVA
ncbi:winged helix-turn-helix domain-containing protein [Streptomyces sp. NPDC001480]|uniref:winged helix-turn-helix domain-containing protein n=1 Tax=Streptomyces sp. NPDC001480 TaxID=3364577 RepID=UPI0036ABDAEE